MLKKIHFIILLTLSAFKGFTQSNDKSVIPPSPQTAEFEKYINYNVSAYNGVPDISIPLYTIRLKGMDIPISLSYHASGIKYRQSNGDVGVGWSLNPGYRISRTIYGLADDRYSMPTSILDSIQAYNEGLERDKFLSQLVDDFAANFPQPYNVTSRLDGEYDIFNFSLPTESGSFVITDRMAKTIQTFEESNVKISYQKGLGSYTNLNGFLKFDVTDDTGNKYYFGERTANDLNYFESPPTDLTLASAWALTDITTALGDQLKFKYIGKHVGGWNAESRTENILDGPVCWTEGHRNYATNTTSFTGDLGYETFLLDELTSSKEKVRLERNSAGFITRLNVFNTTNQLMKAIQFYYSYDFNHFHAFLDSIKVNDQNSNTVQTYRFSYFDKDYPFELAADQWGYYMPGNHTYLHNEFEDDIIRYDDHFNSGPVVALIGGFAFRSRIGSDAVPNIYSLKAITYPTGGETEYEYESNRYQLPGGSVRFGGGMRIKRIKSNDLISNTLTREYIYGNNGCGIPKMYVDESYFVDETLLIEQAFPQNYLYTRRNIIYSTSMQGDVGSTGFTSSLVNYPQVTELYSHGGKVVYNYSIGSEYEPGVLDPGVQGNICRISFQYVGPRFVTGYRFWDKPLLKEKIYFSATNDTLKKELFEYSTNASSLTGLKVRVSARAHPYSDLLQSTYYQMTSSFFRYAPYTITYGKNLLTSQKEVLYQGNRTITTRTDNQYNAQKLLSKSTTYLNNGDKQHTFLVYPTDYATGSGFIDAMVSNNILSEPVEKVSIKESSGGQLSVLSGLITKYKTTIPSLPESMMNVENATPLPISSFKFSNRSVGILPTTGVSAVFTPDITYKTKITFDQFDIANNLIQHSKTNDITTCYIWDYNKAYPVAEITNAAIDNVAYTSFEADGAGNWTLNGTTISNSGVTGTNSFNGTLSKTMAATGNYTVTLWKSASSSATANGLSGLVVRTMNNWQLVKWELANISSITVQGSNIDEVRLLPTKAMMSTYTYQPLIGMTGQCDFNNKTIYYEYDAFGRLSMIKDGEKNILKKICYNFSGQVEDCTPFTNPNWAATGNTRCKPCALNGVFGESMQQKEEKDVNINSPSYNTTRWVDQPEIGAGNCSVDANAWQNTTEIRCKTINELNTGEQERKQINVNPCHPQYSSTRWINIGTNTTTCPLPVGNAARSKTFTRDNCDSEVVAGSYTYQIPANKYMANSQVIADAMAQQEIDQYGQDAANTYATCNSYYYSDNYSGNYYKDNCGTNQGPVAYYVSVPANMFSSLISKQDANNQALQYAQNQANQYGSCQALPMVTIQSSNYDLLHGYHVRLTNTTTQTQYDFQIPYGSSNLGQVPVGSYDVYIYYPGGSVDVYNFGAGCGYATAGTEAEFSGVNFDSSCSTITITNL